MYIEKTETENGAILGNFRVCMPCLGYHSHLAHWHAHNSLKTGSPKPETRGTVSLFSMVLQMNGKAAAALEWRRQQEALRQAQAKGHQEVGQACQ